MTSCKLWLPRIIDQSTHAIRNAEKPTTNAIVLLSLTLRMRLVRQVQESCKYDAIYTLSEVIIINLQVNVKILDHTCWRKTSRFSTLAHFHIARSLGSTSPSQTVGSGVLLPLRPGGESPLSILSIASSRAGSNG